MRDISLNEKLSITIVGLGYVGLPLAIEFSKKYNVIGFDTSKKRIKELNNNIDSNRDIDRSVLKESNIKYSSDPKDIENCPVIIITVPTPIDENNIPDLSLIKIATETVGKHIMVGAVIVYESTVYPGVTEEICVPLLEKSSLLCHKKSFNVGYSPERINPGDKKNKITNITKVVSGDTEETCEFLSKLYGSIVNVGVFKAKSIKVAEAAKVIENIQRDINISLMNELSIIFNKMDINTLDVIDTASTKWNFMKMTPGLVGGHCIGVDPYYLTHKSEMLGYHPKVILSGRRINNGMGRYIAQQTIKKIIGSDINVKGSNVLILGMAFKEDISDIRNSKVIDIVEELQEYGVNVQVCDPLVDKNKCFEEYNFELTDLEEVTHIDAIILAVPHKVFLRESNDLIGKINYITPIIAKVPFIDVKGVYNNTPEIKDIFNYWTL